eukprot:COSAG01_NODE_3164_length_6477_cov_6.494983_5_plen_86_part_00
MCRYAVTVTELSYTVLYTNESQLVKYVYATLYDCVRSYWPGVLAVGRVIGIQSYSLDRLQDGGRRVRARRRRRARPAGGRCRSYS